MNNYDKLQLICKKFIENGWEVLSTERTSCKVKKAFAILNVYFEECTCHGGRISISEEGHTESYYRIEHECYDESKGIVDSETELLWEIENELMEVVNKNFSHLTYKVCFINEYGQKDGKDDERVRYVKDAETALNCLISGGRKSYPDGDLYTLTELVVQCPNPVCRYKYKRIYKEVKYSWDRNKTWFEIQYTDNDGKTWRTYEAYVSVFEKN